MTSLTGNGIAHRNEILLTADRAERFAAMLRANPLFQDVTVREAGKAKGARRYFVTFEPASEGRRQELREYFQAQQDARAESQWAGYVVYRTDVPGRYDVENQQTFDCYRVDLHPAGAGCTCPHFEERCRQEGLRCKHPRIVEIHLALGLVQPVPAVIPAPQYPMRDNGREERLAQAVADRDLWGPAPSVTLAAEERRAQIRSRMAQDFPAD